MITTKDRILELRQQDPGLKAVRISEQLGITKEAVRLNLARLELSTNFWMSPHLCIDCGKPNSSHRAKRCRSCFSKAHHTTLTCEMCGDPYKLTLSKAKLRLRRNKHHFCGRKCMGKWLGQNYGFKRKGTQ